jgi:hypothetical protein
VRKGQRRRCRLKERREQRERVMRAVRQGHFPALKARWQQLQKHKQQREKLC